MAGDNSFDIVSEYDHQEMVNAIDQTQREMRQRYDLKDSGSHITLDKDVLTVEAPSDMTLRSIVDVLESKMVRRGLDLKILSFGSLEAASGGTVRQRITLKHGLSPELARSVVKLIRDQAPKAKAQIQGDAVRVSGKSRDELQRVQQIVRAQDYDLPLQFVNYR
ncbi:MAG TPA: YajQ family cyclic di-GMP-binding protein [Chloroflexota bacterium]|nr:YajQ family cyclic di-GMP-binding protein [Chloroflexota bacterium]